MKKLLLASVLSVSTLSLTAKELTFAMEPTYPPFEVTNQQGEIVGFDVDIANAICHEIQATCHFKGQAFDALIQAVKQKRIDAAISAIDITDARMKQVAFTHTYYDSSASFIAIKGKTDLTKAKNIGVQNGTTFQQYVMAEAKQYVAKSYNSLQDAVLDLKNGRIDMIFGDSAVLADMLSKDQDLNFVGDKVTNEKYFGNGVAIAVNKANMALVDELNQGLATIKANGTYQKIYDKWMTK
ncbi:arginine ABC transporter substrate-binding protein [[Haemophilus] ducreyi]|uniref:Arginine ABC transporter, periplasmic-binding protein n=2 Tax=Haemophilus ducreyi TaxID=730 RepID=Q7VMZ0_HAEDU|nr:transporter substrate-binding domain-containing protein [[Haemophilus] ducreyi]AAP95711.1 arginine ABC transporter, periplasmic-binding protein [[Haemophilus] ducreyi 35000HP]AKO30770.1 arginine ABC transporter substrate-binding protein [[Haemophilus] ducreyi]AKO32208.1 arginine ABC transporter substrate-binding protein [[Haemophilus] ducreyi]AKO33662.1 arginine ABC transporter substrate-binding protein [[Haemophilus] ducreyi]AKO35109.1 arginine ABC transporter substrate-binding protein [[H